GGCVEAPPLHWTRPKANGTQHKTSLSDLQPPGSLRPEPPIGIYDKLVVLDLYGRNPPTRADDLHRGGQKAQGDATRGWMLRAEGIFPQVLQVRLRRAVLLGLCLAGRVELDVFRIDDPGHAFETSQFPELRGRERGLRRAASPHHHDLADPAMAQPLQRMVGEVGLA